MKYPRIQYSISIIAILICTASDCLAIWPAENSPHIDTSDSLHQTSRKDFTMVSGRIMSHNTNLPMSLVNIFIQGTNEGTYSDDEGRFLFQVPINTTLVISHVGYLTARIKIGLGGEFDIVLRQGVFHIPLPAVNDENRLESSITRSPKRTVKMDDEEYLILEQMPNFIYGGFAGLAMDIKQKTLAITEKSEERGLVNLGFTLSAKKEVSDFYILQSDHPKLSEAAESIIRDIKGWIPGKQRGKPVDVRVSIVIEFK